MIITKNICQSLSDQKIISMSLKDIEYFRCLYERYEKKLKNYINKISDFDEDEIQDVLQNTFIIVWRNLNNFDSSLKVSSFLYRIVHNETISYWRKKQSTEKIAKSFVSDVDSETELPNSNIENKHSINIMNILSRLPLKYKEVLILKFLESMDYEEISNILKIPEGTVATRINRAKKAFLKISENQEIKSK